MKRRTVWRSAPALERARRAWRTAHPGRKRAAYRAYVMAVAKTMQQQRG